MSNENPEIRPLEPSHAAHVVHGLCMTLSDLLHQEGSEMSRRSYLKMCALAMAAEMFSRNVAGGFANEAGEAEEILERLMKREVMNGE